MDYSEGVTENYGYNQAWEVEVDKVPWIIAYQ